MTPRVLTAALFVLALAACGQSAQAPPTEAQVASTPAAAPAAPSDAEMQAKVAALPAPLNAADYQNGMRVFAQCRSCHVIEEGAGNRVGPNLHGVFGRHSASVTSFSYSPAMRSANLTWDEPTLERYLDNPRAVVPGTLMLFVGVHKPEDRRDLIAFLAVNSQ
jgi:cytochrome c